MTATIGAMQNNIRSFRVEDQLWLDAVRIAGEQGTSVAEILRDALTRYVQKHGDNPCGVEGHTEGHWVDPELGIFYCPDCNTEIWVGADTTEDKN